MKFRRDRRGFIFSLDATLAMLVVLIVMAGVARVGSPGPIYEQHGYLRLERYAEDALKVMHQTGTLDNVIESIMTGDLSQARETARDSLRTILPEEIQFKFLIGDEENTLLDNVYPGTDDQAWGGVFESAEERAVANRVTAKRLVPLKVLVWVEPDLPANERQMIEDFAEEIRKPSWDVRTTSDEGWFRNYLIGGIGGWIPETVLIPDSRIFEDGTKSVLLNYYNIRHGGVVTGGGFLNYNGDYNFPFFGLWVQLFPPPPLLISELGHENMLIVDHTHPVTAISPDYVDYDGSYPIYELFFLHPSTGEKATPLVDNLAYWPGTWGGEGIEQDWVALTARKVSILAHGEEENQYNRTVLFNSHFAQSAMEGVGTDEWIELAQRAIEWVSNARFESIKLFVWRGEGAS